MENRVNWRMEYEMLSWVLRQEKSAPVSSGSAQHAPILDMQVSRDEIVRSLLTEIETHDGPFGAAALPESVI